MLVASGELGTLRHRQRGHAPDRGSCPWGRARVAEPGQERLVTATREAGICRGLGWRSDPVLAVYQWELVTLPQPALLPTTGTPHIPPGRTQTPSSPLPPLVLLKQGPEGHRGAMRVLRCRPVGTVTLHPSVRAGPRVPSESVFPLFKQSLFHTRCQSLPACSCTRQYI